MKKHSMEKRHSIKSQQKPKVAKCKDKARGPLKNNITYDPRVQSDRNDFLDTELNIIKCKLTEFMCQLSPTLRRSRNPDLSTSSLSDTLPDHKADL